MIAVRSLISHIELWESGRFRLYWPILLATRLLLSFLSIFADTKHKFIFSNVIYYIDLGQVLFALCVCRFNLFRLWPSECELCFTLFLLVFFSFSFNKRTLIARWMCRRCVINFTVHKLFFLLFHFVVVAAIFIFKQQNKLDARYCKA